MAKYIAAISLLELGGKKNRTVEEVATFMKAVGITVDIAELEVAHNKISGKTIEEHIVVGEAKMAAVEAARNVPVPEAVIVVEDEQPAPEVEAEDAFFMGKGLFDSENEEEEEGDGGNAMNKMFGDDDDEY